MSGSVGVQLTGSEFTDVVARRRLPVPSSSLQLVTRSATPSGTCSEDAQQRGSGGVAWTRV